MKILLTFLLILPMTVCALDTEYSNEQEGVRFKILRLDTKPTVRIENNGNLTLALRLPFRPAVSFWDGETRVMERKDLDPFFGNGLRQTGTQIVTFLPPGASIEIPLYQMYFNTKEPGYGREFSWSEGAKTLPPGKYKVKITSNGAGLTALDLNTTPFKTNFDIPAFEIEVP